MLHNGSTNIFFGQNTIMQTPVVKQLFRYLALGQHMSLRRRRNQIYSDRLKSINITRLYKAQLCECVTYIILLSPYHWAQTNDRKLGAIPLKQIERRSIS